MNRQQRRRLAKARRTLNVPDRALPKKLWDEIATGEWVVKNQIHQRNRRKR